MWDPATGTFTPVNLTGYNVFCSGLAHLMDGSLFLAGGNKNDQLEGIAQTHVFDSDTNTWSRGADMAEDRWYPTVTPLHNGELLITEGGPDVPEVRETDGALRALSTASLNLPLYPWIDVAPDGRAFYSGPDPTMRSLAPAGGGSWQTFGQRDSLFRGYGSHVLYDRGKILVAGGQLSSRDARVIDLNGATPQTSSTEPMEYGRRQHNLTVLADGTVLATGGLSSGAELVDMDNGVYPAERWNPATGRWRTLAAMEVTRQYHSTALLLPDARVLSSGGGVCGACDPAGYLAKNAEVFSPPYLFKNDGSGELAPRPEITSAPDEMTYNAPFSVSTPDADSIRKVALVRLGAVTHSVNMDQRYVPLSFTDDGDTVDVTAPANANLAPPGVYMLFVIDEDGVPSVARMVRVGLEPTTTITAGPSAGTNDPTPTFSFSSQPGTSFACKLDSGPYTPCSSPITAPRLPDGPHTFSVRATDAAGNTDPTPATRAFTVKTAEVRVSGSTLIVTAAPGAKDNISISRPSASVLRVSDFPAGPYTGSGVHTGPGCAPSGDSHRQLLGLRDHPGQGDGRRPNRQGGQLDHGPKLARRRGRKRRLERRLGQGHPDRQGGSRGDERHERKRRALRPRPQLRRRHQLRRRPHPGQRRQGRPRPAPQGPRLRGHQLRDQDAALRRPPLAGAHQTQTSASSSVRMPQASG